jgi:hypothetical protein
VDAERRATRRSVQVVVGVSVGVALLLAIFNHQYVKPYDGPLGQLVLVLVILLYVAAFLWLRRLARFELPDRFLGDAQDTAVVARQDSVPLRSSAAMDAGGGS